MNEIRCTNIIYISNISKLGGVESYAYYMARKYRDYDIMVLCKIGDITQLARIRKYCPAVVHHGEKIYCKTMIINYDTSILDYLAEGKVYMTVHADYSQSCYKILPKWHDTRITKVLAITEHIQKILKEKFNVDSELCYNPLVLEEKQKRLTLVSATRLSAIKGGERMRQLANELDLAGVNYVWYVFTGDGDCIHSPNVIFIPPRLNVYKWLQEADLVIQLSDTEACSYTISEARAYGVQTCTTPLPYLESIGINRDNAIILEFDCSNIKEVVEQIKNVKKVNWKAPEDNYKEYLVESKSKYKEMISTMKKIRVKQPFKDMMHGDCRRTIGEEFIEDTQRADDLIARGFCYLVEDYTEPVERAVKEVKKETAVKEKATKKEEPKKATKKNAKK